MEAVKRRISNLLWDCELVSMEEKKDHYEFTVHIKKQGVKT
jgi:hypothetical protein